MTDKETIKSLIHRFEQCSRDGTGYFDAELSPEECKVVVLALCGLSAISQIEWERDIAIQQLQDLGYEFGEKPRKDDQISRSHLLKFIGKLEDRALKDNDITNVIYRCVTATTKAIQSYVEDVPSTQPEIIYCKDCVKHNKGHGRYLDGTFTGVKDCCPLVEIRGFAQGHEFDYQYCAYAKRRTDNADIDT